MPAPYTIREPHVDTSLLGADGFMVLPATGLPIMLYNNPPSYRVNIDIATLERLTERP